MHATDDAQKGISLLETVIDDVALAVVDAVMPGLGGHVVVEEILKQRPQTSIVITSGFSHDYVRGILPLGAWRFLQKPFDAGEFVSVVNGCVGGTG